MAEYTAPAIEKIADYSKVTRGSAIGVWRDYYGAWYGWTRLPLYRINVNKPLDMQSTVVLFHFIPLRSSENLGE